MNTSNTRHFTMSSPYHLESAIMILRRAVFIAAAFTASAANADSLNLRKIYEAWSGYNENGVDIISDGLRCRYTQIGEPELGDPPRVIVGFRTMGCPVPHQSYMEKFSFIVSRVIAHREGNLCILTCKDNTSCMTAVGEKAPPKTTVKMPEVRPGSCDALNAALQEVAPAVEAAIAAERSRLEQEERAKQAAASAAAEAAKQRSERLAKARADCGTSPKIVGGPWFSSTYGIGAQKMATELVSNGQFHCIKEIRYTGPDVNPFGGSAARAEFVGYNSSGQGSIAVAGFLY